MTTSSIGRTHGAGLAALFSLAVGGACSNAGEADATIDASSEGSAADSGDSNRNACEMLESSWRQFVEANADCVDGADCLYIGDCSGSLGGLINRSARTAAEPFLTLHASQQCPGGLQDVAVKNIRCESGRCNADLDTCLRDASPGDVTAPQDGDATADGDTDATADGAALPLPPLPSPPELRRSPR
jgi:hypothetical protein